MVDMLDVLLNLLQQKIERPGLGIEMNANLHHQLRSLGVLPPPVIEEALTVTEMSKDSIRVYMPYELDKLSAECRGMLAYFERINLIDFRERESIIETLLQLPEMPIEVSHLLVVVALRLLLEPEKLEVLLMTQDLLHAQKNVTH